MLTFDACVCVFGDAHSDTFGAVESVKAASDLYTPASGTVTAVNDVRTSSLLLLNVFGSAFMSRLTECNCCVQNLVDEPNLVNDEAMSGGWFIKLEVRYGSSSGFE